MNAIQDDDTLPDVDDILPPPFEDPIGDWPETAPTQPGGLPSAVELDLKNPARGLKKLEKLAAELELERAKEARYKAQAEAKMAKAPPAARPRKEREANGRQICPETKRDGTALLETFVYLGKTCGFVG